MNRHDLGTLETYDEDVWHSAIAAAVRGGVTFKAWTDSRGHGNVEGIVIYIITYTGGY